MATGEKLLIHASSDCMLHYIRGTIVCKHLHLSSHVWYLSELCVFRPLICVFLVFVSFVQQLFMVTYICIQLVSDTWFAWWLVEQRLASGMLSLWKSMFCISKISTRLPNLSIGQHWVQKTWCISKKKHLIQNQLKQYLLLVIRSIGEGISRFVLICFYNCNIFIFHIMWGCINIKNWQHLDF